MTGPKLHVRRDENMPIGNMPSTGRGAGNAARTVMALLESEWTLMVVRASNGDVYALDPCGLRATATTNVHPGMDRRHVHASLRRRDDCGRSCGAGSGCAEGGMTVRRKSAPHPRVGLHIEISRLLQGRALTAIDLGAMLEKEQAGVDSALRGMERRGEVIRMPHLPGTWAKWALRGRA